MTDLVLEYVLDGKRPGYNFTSPTNGCDDATLKTIWRSAMPRGQGWRGYIGAHALKCFPLDGGRRVAISDVTVTDQEDEHGRRGIRRAEITLLEGGQYLDYLALRLEMLPDSLRQGATSRLNWWRWKRIMDRATPKARKKSGQIALTAVYDTPHNWQLMEALVLTIATALRTRLVKGWPQVFPLTTLALDYREESQLIALPLAKAQQLNGLKAIRVD